MKLFAQLKTAITNAVTRFKKRETKKLLNAVAPTALLWPPRRFVCSWERVGLMGVRRRTFKGPAFAPDAAHHHASRQTCRAYLRDLCFFQLSQQFSNAHSAVALPEWQPPKNTGV